MILPSKSPITLPFGSTADPYSPDNPHKGTDFAHSPDNVIYAPFTGTVTLSPNNGNDGNAIYMHDGGDFHGLLHSSKYLVSSGEHVNEGQPIAIMGETGYAFGVHLHWCVKRNGVFIDPMSLIKEETVSYIAPETTTSLFADFGAGVPTADQLTYYEHHPAGYAELFKDLLKYNYDARKAAEANAAKLQTEYDQLKVLKAQSQSQASVSLPSAPETVSTTTINVPPTPVPAPVVEPSPSLDTQITPTSQSPQTSPSLPGGWFQVIKFIKAIWAALTNKKG